MRIKEKNNNKLRKYCYDLSIKELILWYERGSWKNFNVYRCNINKDEFLKRVGCLHGT